MRNSLYRAVVLHILFFSVSSIILADLLGNTYLLTRVQKVMVCDS